MVERLSTVYNVFFYLIVPMLLVRAFWRGRRFSGYRDRWQERFSIGLPAGPAQRPVWIHAVSVGESVAATPIVEEMRERFPDAPILFTTTTPTGADAAMRRFGDSVLQVYFPYDLPLVVRRFVEHFNPRCLILMETELWPNLLHCCKTKSVPVMMANARLSQKSAWQYRRVPSITAAMLSAVDYIAVQGFQDRDRFLSLGVDHDAIEVTGNLKFDIDLPSSVMESGRSLRRFLGTSRAVLIAGSTRDGEEEILLQVFADLKAKYSDLLLLIAPRHPERFDSVAALCRTAGFQISRKSCGDSCPPESAIYLVDSMGELPSFYAASDVAFVGGSMRPFGGHNVLEPAALGIPVVVGRYTYNFTEIVGMLSAVGALTVAENQIALGNCIEEWFRNSESRDLAGAAGRRMVAENKGAIGRVVRMIDRVVSLSS
ncbi:MAG TPA: 3-deoxy-D-manno-octulosonic acid transferase [Gammaproteobacteria bacterium]|nr:3-deoxy-D-manno-octulosonic acid transferase [Gammaproteobacteria bacterium]|tara:strand:- start:1962 stop:3248 length:1287 start_codon:yes stop_codon:yes gene_type:complete